MAPFSGRSRQSSVTSGLEVPKVDSKPRRSMPNLFGQRSSEGVSATSLSVPDDKRKTRSSGDRTPRSSPEPGSFTPAGGHPGNLNEDQQRAYHALEQALLEAELIPSDNPPAHQPAQLLRFLRARNFDVDAAKLMYSNAEKWKESIQLEKLYREFQFEERDLVAKHGWRMYFHKTDRLGRPIFVQDLSNLQPEKVFSHTSQDRIIQNFAVTLEHAVRHRYDACTESQGHLVDDNYMVLNVAGLGLSTFWAMKGQLQQLLSVLDDNFPELSGRVQIINAPYLFSTVWSYVKGWLPAQTAAKIDIAGTDYMSKVSSYVNLEAWPKHLGGECECEQPSPVRACETSDAGPWKSREESMASCSRKLST
ncbi:hypothetical protein MYAM1_001717 [Malassezia yamatoensis]|uniref:CRAL-TRIO domain-containing protein n=1 Tax=Malassezia yamatoensis TaxID=253288 RepID=A0AAJ6CHN3_9BASI|nr:hypothetical protein MYAM1_001717 [Malassezia yamatoensis]